MYDAYTERNKKLSDANSDLWKVMNEARTAQFLAEQDRDDLRELVKEAFELIVFPENYYYEPEEWPGWRKRAAELLGVKE